MGIGVCGVVTHDSVQGPTYHTHIAAATVQTRTSNHGNLASGTPSFMLARRKAGRKIQAGIVLGS